MVLENKIDKQLRFLLERLYSEAQGDFTRIREQLVKAQGESIQPSDFKDAFLPVSMEQGLFFRQLILEKDIKHVVEFGTSFGISSLFLADAVKETGGQVISTELIETKAQKALDYLRMAKLDMYVDIRIGDAMKTMSGYNEPIDFLLLDGWKDLYLPLFRMLEPCFHADTIIYADNVDMLDTLPFTSFIEQNKEHYNRAFLHSNKGLLITCIKG